MSIESIIRDLRDRIRIEGCMREDELWRYMLNHFFTSGEADTIVKNIPCDDIHVMEYKFFGDKRSASVYLYNPSTNPVPIRT